MRVISGIAKSLKLKCPEGIETRPTTDRIKETLFNMLQNDIWESIFIDLYAGSGAIGIEALSRGAQKCYFIDKNRQSVQCITDNLYFTKLFEKAIIKQQDAIDSLYTIKEDVVDIIFIDPPYNQGNEERLLEALSKCAYVTYDTIIIIEASLETEFDFCEKWGYSIANTKKYKTNKHVFIRKTR